MRRRLVKALKMSNNFFAEFSKKLPRVHSLGLCVGRQSGVDLLDAGVGGHVGS